MLSIDLSTLLKTLLVGVLAYAGIVLCLRLSGKRTLSKWNAFDFVVTIAIGSMLGTTTLSSSTTLSQGLTAMALLVVLQFTITWLSVRSASVRRLMKAEPTLLLRDGEFLRSALMRERVTEAEIRAALRASGIGAMESAAAVVLETDGSFSVIPRQTGNPYDALSDVPGFWHTNPCTEYERSNQHDKDEQD